MRQLVQTATGLSALSFVMIGAGAAPKEPIGMPNPASAHCAKIGGRSEIARDAVGNATGYCHMPDGQVCEEWALFRDRKCVAPKD
ncbi:DUF333 domain-containing protein [Mesorhizobium sp. ANAO-SY3R2]|uniref:putative hemolysin n=1 Tax=Mesorhizobium sp. ANAO-SY3R2 TaxID=3166644 RepID=UPI00366BBA7B